MRRVPPKRGFETLFMATAALGLMGLTGCNGNPTPEVPPAGPDAPIEADARVWQWVDFPESRCADGSPTGIGINLNPGATRAYVYLQGGGACWTHETCFGVPIAFNLDGFGVDEFDGLFTDAQLDQALFDRDDPENPLADAHHVFVPYCTGDAFLGNRRTTLTGPLGIWQEEIHFNGAANIQTFLRRLGPTFEGVDHIVVAGSSAGGFGAAFNWWAFKETFPDARVDVLDDSGPPVEPVDGRWQQWQQTWGIDLPDGCEGCENSVMAVIEHAGRTLARQGRFGLLSSDGDLIISIFMGHDPWTFSWRLWDLADVMDGVEGLHYFFTDSLSHTFLARGIDGVTARDGQDLRRWIGAMIEDDPDWASAR